MTILDSLMEKFRALVPEAAAVIRDGVTKPVAATEIVIGDIIRLKSGNNWIKKVMILFDICYICDEVSFAIRHVQGYCNTDLDLSFLIF